MIRLVDRQVALFLALPGILCCLGAGCAHESEEGYRTYQQTIADSPPADSTAVTDVTPSHPAADAPRAVTEDDGPTSPPATTDSAADTQTTDTSQPSAGPPTDPAPDNTLAVSDPIPAPTGVADPAPSLPAAPATATAAPTTAASGPREIKLLVPDASFQTEGPEGAVRVSYNDIDLLKVLNMDPVTRSAPRYFPGWLTALGDQRVRLRGFMYPPPVETGIPAFLLARDNQICCFGRNPKPYDIIPVILRDDVTTDYINGRPFDVVGVFHIGVEMDLDDPTRVKTVYYIDDALVIDE